ncbi:MAG TPA: chemotaxis protein CheW [Alphaproteobacteria bacterium]|nr:chemotaxis protein CheW [Alphaproteobacteria bacterium]
MSGFSNANTARRGDDPSAASDRSSDYLTIVIAGQMFGIPVLQIQDVLGPQKVTRIPLAPPEVAGSLNLRGRIVTAIDVRRRLGLDAAEDGKSRNMSVVVEQEGELYSLVIDRVGDVLTLYQKDFEANPPTLDPVWRTVSLGVYRLERELLVILDVARLLGSIKT